MFPEEYEELNELVLPLLQESIHLIYIKGGESYDNYLIKKVLNYYVALRDENLYGSGAILRSNSTDSEESRLVHRAITHFSEEHWNLYNYLMGIIWDAHGRIYELAISIVNRMLAIRSYLEQSLGVKVRY